MQRRQGRDDVDYTVELVELAPQPCAVVRGHVALEAIPGFLGQAYGDVMGVLAGEQVSPAGPPFARYHVTGDGLDVEAGFPVTGPVSPTGRVTAGEQAGGLVATVMHRGDYGKVEQAYRAAEDWLAVNGYVPAGEPWESYLDGPEVAEPRTVVSLPCRKG